MTCVFTHEGRRCGRVATAICALCSEPACFEHGAPPIHFGPMRPLPSLARAFGVGRTAVSYIRQRRTWKELE